MCLLWAASITAPQTLTNHFKCRWETRRLLPRCFRSSSSTTGHTRLKKQSKTNLQWEKSLLMQSGVCVLRWEDYCRLHLSANTKKHTAVRLDAQSRPQIFICDGRICAEARLIGCVCIQRTTLFPARLVGTAVVWAIQLAGDLISRKLNILKRFRRKKKISNCSRRRKTSEELRGSAEEALGNNTS